MQSFRFENLRLPNIKLVTPLYVEDERGAIEKTYSKDVFLQAGINFVPEEEMYITSRAGVLRGLHFQRRKPQAKLLRCLKGRIWVVAADVCLGSSTLGKWVAAEISDKSLTGMYVPAGYAVGTLALEDSIIGCQCDEKFYADYAAGIRWNDNDLGISWPIHQLEEDLVIALKDLSLPSLRIYISSVGGKRA